MPLLLDGERRVWDSLGITLYEMLTARKPYTRGEDTPMAYAEVMRHAIAFNGSFFTAQRMFDQYRRNAYRRIQA